MTLGTNGEHIIKTHEGCKLHAYLDIRGIPTIGYGNTFYLDGTKVKMGDIITQEQAEQLFELIANKFVTYVNQVVKAKINQNQFDALVSLTYNIGTGAFWSSTVLRLVNINPADTHITDAFKMWDKADGVISEGLLQRRIDEAKLYFS